MFDAHKRKWLSEPIQTGQGRAFLPEEDWTPDPLPMMLERLYLFLPIAREAVDICGIDIDASVRRISNDVGHRMGEWAACPTVERALVFHSMFMLRDRPSLPGLASKKLNKAATREPQHDGTTMRCGDSEISAEQEARTIEVIKLLALACEEAKALQMRTVFSGASIPADIGERLASLVEQIEKLSERIFNVKIERQRPDGQVKGKPSKKHSKRGRKNDWRRDVRVRNKYEIARDLRECEGYQAFIDANPGLGKYDAVRQQIVRGQKKIEEAGRLLAELEDCRMSESDFVSERVKASNAMTDADLRHMLKIARDERERLRQGS